MSAPLLLPAAMAMVALLSPTRLHLDTGVNLPGMWDKREHGSIEVESFNTVYVWVSAKSERIFQPIQF